jgi:hypothetical protein
MHTITAPTRTARPAPTISGRRVAAALAAAVALLVLAVTVDNGDTPATPTDAPPATVLPPATIVPAPPPWQALQPTDGQ